MGKGNSTITMSMTMSMSMSAHGITANQLRSARVNLRKPNPSRTIPDWSDSNSTSLGGISLAQAMHFYAAKDKLHMEKPEIRQERVPRTKRSPSFFHNETFVLGSGACRRVGYDPTDMTWNGDDESGDESDDEPVQHAIAITVDGRAVVVAIESENEYIDSDSEDEDEDEWVSEDENEYVDSDSEDEDEDECVWKSPEVGMEIEEKWKMENGTTEWFKGTINAVNRRVYKIRWNDGSETAYYMSSWNDKVATESNFKIID